MVSVRLAGNYYKYCSAGNIRGGIVENGRMSNHGTILENRRF